MSVESHVIGVCARASSLEQGRAARSGSTQRDETKTILHIWQSTEQSDPLTIVMEMWVRNLGREIPRMSVEPWMEMCMQMNVDDSWNSVASCSPRSGKLS
uniref:Uncharacterized protein n=1 Tax=Spumella elongata TaxID=89044 RepID=A0A7S3HLN5_9STRA|mmetsp:Transcript_58086/g.102117  ORF Transcript_58086/g.102117 Transcript_58086/m.102117 type:complete len:100 (+) Transcript_58086:156-455(+)